MKQRIKIFAIMGWLVFALAAFAQENCDATKWKRVENSFTAKTQTYKQEVEKNKHKATIALSITLAIGVLGAASAFLQQVQRNWSKTATMIAGGLVAILTVVNTNVFDGDHRAFNKKAMKIEGVIEQIHSKLDENFNVENCQDLEDQRNEIQRLLTELHRIKFGDDQSLSLPEAPSPSPPEAQPAAQPEGSLFIGTAFAQETKKSSLPSWVNNPPQEKNKIYFIGIGYGQSLKAAEASATSDGREQAQDFFAQAFGQTRQTAPPAVDSKAIAAFLTNYVQAANKYFIYNPKEKAYTYYALIRVDRDLTEDYLNVYAAQEGLADVKSYSDIIQNAPGLSNDYLSRRRVKYEELANKAQKGIPQEVFAEFERGRQLRKTGQIAGAIKSLTAATEKQPDFYLAWYNLALAYMATNDHGKTDAAFKKAVEYEQLQSLRDASLYNSYGWFLYLNKRYAEAVKIFERALVIDPNHPKAKNNLAAAKKAIGG